jgi:hypothetical protein
MLRRGYTPFGQLDIKNTILKILDGTGTPNTVTVKIGEGNVTWTEKKPRQYTKNRGRLDGVRNGDEEPVELKIDCRWDFYKSDGSEDVTPVEAIKQQGAASSWTTTGSDDCEPYAVDIHIEYNISCGATADELYVFPEFRYEQIEFDLRAGTFSVSGMCNVTEPTVTRTTL